MDNLPEQNPPSHKGEKYVSVSWFSRIMAVVGGFLLFFGYNIYNRIETLESNYRNDMKNINDKYQSDHDKITKFEDLKVTIQNDHDNLLKLEERLNNIKYKNN